MCVEMSVRTVFNDKDNFAPSLFGSECEIVGQELRSLTGRNIPVPKNQSPRIHTMTSKNDGA